ncbi:MAG: erythromycin esterase family protein [Polyangiaceae bacterium]
MAARSPSPKLSPSTRWLPAVVLAATCAIAGACGPQVPAVETPAEKPAAPAALDGEVLSASGEPVAAAVVSVSSHFDLDERDPAYDAVTNDRGQFHFAALPPGRYGVTATSPDHAGGYAGVVTIQKDAKGAPHITVRLGPKDRSALLEGTVRDDKGAALAGARVLAPALGENEGEVYVALTDPAGHYRLRLPTTTGYFLLADADPRPRAYKQVEPRSQTVDFTLDPPPAPRPRDEEIAAWVRAHAKALSGDKELTPESAKAFSEIIGDAPLVAMGEATHGSGTFGEWRQRVFQSLVRDKGFTIYAAEVGFAEALAVDDYVVNGTGDAKTALRGLVTWKDETQETLALVEWMRAYDADPKHTNKLHFQGFDALTFQAVPMLIGYLKKVDPGSVAAAEKALGPLTGVESDSTYPALPADAQARTRADVAALLAKMDANRTAYVAKSTEAEWARARQLARVIQQAEVSYGDYTARDAQMVENVKWLLDHSPAGTKALLDAHNGHIAAETHGLIYMGRMLREQWGARYVPIGFAFGEGSLLALDWQNGPSNDKKVFTVGRAKTGTFDGDLALSGIPAFVLDLRGADGPVGAYLRSQQRVHHVGGRFVGEAQSFERYTPARAFDAVIYLDKVTAIHPLPR